MAGHNRVMGGGGFHHVALKVHDFDRSVRLYTEVLGFAEKIRWGAREGEKDARAIMLDTGDGNYLELFAGGPKPVKFEGPERGILHMAFRTNDVEACAARVRAVGLEITMEPKDVNIPSTPPTPVRIAFCRGFDEELIEFFQNETT